jgi:hypothetical protein
MQHVRRRAGRGTRRAGSRRATVFSAFAAVALTALSCARHEPLALDARAVADVSLAPASVFSRQRAVNAFRPGLGVRAGIASYPQVQVSPIRDRTMIGAHVHFGEDEVHRYEGAFALLQSSIAPDETYYWSAELRYVAYLGSGGYANVSCGGGAMVETWYGQTSSAPYASVGCGWWVPCGGGGVDFRVELQALLSEDPGAPYVVLAYGVYDL